MNHHNGVLMPMLLIISYLLQEKKFSDFLWILCPFLLFSESLKIHDVLQQTMRKI